MTVTELIERLRLVPDPDKTEVYFALPDDIFNVLVRSVSVEYYSGAVRCVLYESTVYEPALKK